MSLWCFSACIVVFLFLLQRQIPREHAQNNILFQSQHTTDGVITPGDFVVLIGDQRKFLTVLIAPTEGGTTPSPDQVKEALASYNENLAMSRAQRVQKAHVIDKPFTVEAGDLTPTMKLKRNVVVRKYASEIEAMYAQTSGLVGYSSTDIGSLLK